MSAPTSASATRSRDDAKSDARSDAKHEDAAAIENAAESSMRAPPSLGPTPRTPVVVEPSEPAPAARDGDGRSAERPSARLEEYFTHYGVGPTIDTREDPLSTFSVDVDTASYAMARSHLHRGQLPPEAAIRVEEVVNYFDYRYPPPAEGEFSLHAEVVPSPQRQGYHLLHLGLKAKEVTAAERPNANLVFVVDVSGSMGNDGRLDLVKTSLRQLVGQLRASDHVAIVAYGEQARVVLPPTPGSSDRAIVSAVDALSTEGATNVEAGLTLGYALAAREAKGAGINRVVLFSDGVANTGATTTEELLRRVAAQAEQGITITTIGVGMGEYNDTLMETLADEGDGNYAYVDDPLEARRVFVDHLTGTLQVVAKDVKIQLELDPRAVARYRLLGYENRALSRSEFDDDQKDAGELGAGHTVTALYEVRLHPGVHDTLGTLRVRYKTPRAATSTKISRDLPGTLVRHAWAEAAPPTQLSVVAAAYAEKLRGSYWVRTLTWAAVQALYAELDADLRRRPEVAELGRLIDTAARLDQRGDRFEVNLPVARMDFDRVPVLQ